MQQNASETKRNETKQNEHTWYITPKPNQAAYLRVHVQDREAAYAHLLRSVAQLGECERGETSEETLAKQNKPKQFLRGR